MTWALDLDGVVWRGESAIAGSPEAISRLVETGTSVAFVTNSSSKRSAEYVTKLERFGITASEDRVVHAGHALGSLIDNGDRVLLCAGEGAREGLVDAGAEIIEPDQYSNAEPVDAVVLGWKPDFEYRLLAVATEAVLAGARLVAMNMDPLYPKDGGMVPGTGSLATAVAYATGTEPVFAGKPSAAMAAIVTQRFGTIDVFVGDQPGTDGGLAEKLNAKFVLVSTGVAAAVGSRQAPVPVAAEVDDLRSAVDLLGIRAES
jgi:glycerol-1-phosphatase